MCLIDLLKCVLSGTLQVRFDDHILSAVYLFFRKDKVYVCLYLIDQVLFQIIQSVSAQQQKNASVL